MKFKLISASLAVLFSSAVIAGNLPPKPNHCPSVSALKAVGVNAARTMDNDWVAFQSGNRYNTNAEWWFGVGAGATNAKDAVTQGNAAIGSLQQQGEMESFDDETSGAGWACIYLSNSAFAVAVTPTSTVPPNAFSFTKRK
jgi:hypothetical protein